MSEDLVRRVSHFGICTSDLERSIRFYTEALGFTLGHCQDVGPPLDRVTELPDMRSRACFVTHGKTTIELLGYQRPAVVGSSERRPMNQLGITHLCLVVNDLDALADRIAKYGGQVLADTRVEAPAGTLIFCTDPDGVRIELWQRPPAG